MASATFKLAHHPDPSYGIKAVVFVDQVHECRFVEKREHAVEILEVVFEQRVALLPAWEWFEYASVEEVIEDFRAPVFPAGLVIRGCRRDHILEGSIASLLVHPLYAFRTEDREARRRTDISRFANVVRDEATHLIGKSIYLFGVFGERIGFEALLGSGDVVMLVCGLVCCACGVTMRWRSRHSAVPLFAVWLLWLLRTGASASCGPLLCRSANLLLERAQICLSLHLLLRADHSF